MVPWIWQHFDAFASNIQHLTFIIDLYTLVSVAFVLFIKEARYRTQAKQQWTSCWIFYPHRRAKCCTSFMGYVFIHILSLFPECYSGICPFKRTLWSSGVSGKCIVFFLLWIQCTCTGINFSISTIDCSMKILKEFWYYVWN